MSLLVGTDGGGSVYWSENISSLNVIIRQPRTDNTDRSEDSLRQADELSTNERAGQA